MNELIAINKHDMQKKNERLRKAAGT